MRSVPGCSDGTGVSQSTKKRSWLSWATSSENTYARESTNPAMRKGRSAVLMKLSEAGRRTCAELWPVWVKRGVCVRDNHEAETII